VGHHLESGQYVAQSGLHLHQCEPHSCKNIQITVREFLSHMNANSVFNFPFPCKQGSAYEYVYYTLE